MLDIKFIRENLELVKAAVANKNEKGDLDALLAADDERRALQPKADELRAERNARSKQIGELKKAGENADALQEEVKNLKQQLDDLEEREKELGATIRELGAWFPNIPHESVPVGQSEDDNEVVRTWGDIPERDFEVKPHWEVGESLGLLDFDRASKFVGSNWALFTDRGARLERALINFMLNLHTQEHGYTEMSPPFVANEACMYGTGQIPKMKDDMYISERDEMYLIPTAEVPLTNIHAGETLKPEDLPVCYTAYTPCFRREAGAYGADTRGLMRLHQFDKVELVKLAHPDHSWDELESLTANAEKVLQLLERPYRVITLCTGDLSFASAKTYDLEVWAPGCDRWLEVSSCSNFLDFQARRANIRFRDENKKVRFVHTLNGSGLAMPRTVIGILEHYQQADGSVVVPEVLRPFMGCEVLD
jgi:seryl-tRNA synthetase